jgi:DNA helicase-2/ATP-dependent DNA helicase PcrA
MAITLSPQQEAILAAVATRTDSLLIEAGAGCAKTTILVESLRIIPDKEIAFCAYNKAIAKEIEYKTQSMKIPGLKTGTVHSFGFASYRLFQKRVKVDGNKLKNLAMEEFYGEYESIRQFVVEAVDMAKQVGMGILLDENNDNNWYELCERHNIFDSLPDKYNTADAINAARHLLAVNNNIKDVIDFGDMIYFPILFKLRMKLYDYVLLDEAQDTNPVRRALVRRMLKPGGRLIAVGDKKQAIYGFTGADSDALDRIKEEFNTYSLPLSVTYRCPKKIVELAYKWVDKSVIQAHESAPDGIVDDCELAQIYDKVTSADAILCRNTKPLVELAYSLLRKQIACKVEGRSIGEGLIRIVQRWKTVRTVAQFSQKLEEWKEKEIAKNRAKGNDNKCQDIEDRADTLQVFILQCEDDDPLSVLIANIRKMFGDSEQGKQQVLTLSTIHKSKGREWDHVFALGMDTYSPSKWASKEWELEQEDNLCYVQVTRSKNQITLVNVPKKTRS